jgi:hypothetical protein
MAESWAPSLLLTPRRANIFTSKHRKDTEMAQTLTLGRQAPIARTGRTGVLNSILAYLAAAGAASRTAVAVSGRFQPSEQDMQTLGIERTEAYSAVVRH